MAQDALTKDELRRDPVQDLFFHGVDYVHRHRRLLSAIGAGVLTVLVIGIGYYLYDRRSTAQVATAFNTAEAPLFDQTQSEDDRIAKSREAFKGFVTEHGASRLAPYAWMRLGSIAAHLGENEAAEDAFRRVVEHAHATPPVRAIARTALAKLYEDKGELDRSTQQYQALAADAFGDLAEFSLARVALAGNKADEARKRLEAVQQQYPESSLAALARDTLYFVH